MSEILYLGKTEAGRVHDKKMIENEQIHFKNPVNLGADLGYLGLEAPNIRVFLPFKKPKGGELTEIQKAENQCFSSYRVGIEHVNSAIKRCRTVKETLRLKTDGVLNLVMLLACALHNFRISNRAHRLLVFGYPHEIV